jgi:nucleoside-diphosphate-sugar epimerase
MNLTQSKILMTGTTGFIGGHLVRHLRTEKGASARVLVRDPAKAEGLAKRGVELFEGSPSNSRLLYWPCRLSVVQSRSSRTRKALRTTDN